MFSLPIYACLSITPRDEDVLVGKPKQWSFSLPLSASLSQRKNRIYLCRKGPLTYTVRVRFFFFFSEHTRKRQFMEENEKSVENEDVHKGMRIRSTFVC